VFIIALVLIGGGICIFLILHFPPAAKHWARALRRAKKTSAERADEHGGEQKDTTPSGASGTSR
jgi:hypothetical protein